LRTVKPIDLYP